MFFVGNSLDEPAYKKLLLESKSFTFPAPQDEMQPETNSKSGRNHFSFCNKELVNEGVGVDKRSPNSRAGNA